MLHKEHHIVANNNGWSIIRAGAAKASVNTDTQAEAVKIGRAISQRQGSKLIIRHKNQIQRSEINRQK